MNLKLLWMIIMITVIAGFLSGCADGQRLPGVSIGETAVAKPSAPTIVAVSATKTNAPPVVKPTTVSDDFEEEVHVSPEIGSKLKIGSTVQAAESGSATDSTHDAEDIHSHVTAGNETIWLTSGKWGRVSQSLTNYPNDSLAKSGYEEITFRPDGTFDMEGWHLQINFKLTGVYEMRGDQLFMKDTKMLWQKGGDLNGTIWDENMFPKQGTLGPYVTIQLSGDDNWTFAKDVSYDWTKHRVVDTSGHVITVKDDGEVVWH